MCVDPNCKLLHGYYAVNTQVKKCIECRQTQMKDVVLKARLEKAMPALREQLDCECYSNPSDDTEEEEYNIVRSCHDSANNTSEDEAVEYNEDEDFPMPYNCAE